PSLLLPVAEEVAVELGGTARLRALIGVVVHHRYAPYIVVGPEGARSADARARRRRSDDQPAVTGPSTIARCGPGCGPSYRDRRPAPLRHRPVVRTEQQTGERVGIHVALESHPGATLHVQHRP